MQIFVRTCQECGKRVKSVDPQGNPKPFYNSRACPKCKSEAFDYGSLQDVDPRTLERLPESDECE